MLDSLGLVSEFPSLITLLPFKLRGWFVFPCDPGGWVCTRAPQLYCSLLHFVMEGVVLFLTMFLLPFSMFSPLSFVVQRLFNQPSAFPPGDCFICGWRFSLSLGEDDFSVFLHNIMNSSMIIVSIQLSDPGGYHLVCVDADRY